MGDASYAFYILQAPLSSWFELLLKRLANVDQWIRSPLLVGVFFLLLAGASVLSFEFVEKPCRRLIQKRFRTPVYSLPRPADVAA